MKINKTLADELIKIYDVTPAEGKVAIKSQIDNLLKSGMMENVIKEGDDMPGFVLPDQTGELVDSDILLTKGPLVISFYRGAWCPYCNLELQSLQSYLPEIHELGAELVAISPNKPDDALTLQEKHHLEFKVLSDDNNLIAKKFGLVFEIEELLRPMYKKMGVDLEIYNGNNNWEIPIPATYVIDQDGVVKSYIDVDWSKRVEPMEIIRTLEEIHV